MPMTKRIPAGQVDDGHHRESEESRDQDRGEDFIDALLGSRSIDDRTEATTGDEFTYDRADHREPGSDAKSRINVRKRERKT
jgi:hypothetical protein